MSHKVRVRFAPSPTGPLHIGGVRTALYNYLFAKKNNGAFILRIEDTDRNRFVPQAGEYILNSLKWCGIEFDEGSGKDGGFGPYIQSERKDIYQYHAKKLIDSGAAYCAFDSPDELDSWRARMKEKGVHTPQYDSTSRMELNNSLSLSDEIVRDNLEKGIPYVIRLKIPENETIGFTDLIREEVSFNTNVLDDKVLIKADGMPTYHLANVVDDYLMKISHVIRGEEWLSSTPLHVQLYKAFGWEDAMPRFAHLPLILKPEGNGKLSKRDSDRMGFPIFPLSWEDPVTAETSVGFKERGFLPEALLNMLAFLGWNPGTEQEIFTKDELIKAFSIDGISKSGGRFDFEKGKWFNQQFIMKCPNAELADKILPLLEAKGIHKEIKYIEKACGLMKERVSLIPDIVIDGHYLFNAPSSYDEKMVRKKWKEQSPWIITSLMELFESLSDFNSEFIETNFKEYLESNELNFGLAMIAMRLVITGRGNGPSLFDTLELIGKEETLSRMRKGVKNIKKD